ncbi:MAG: pesticin C-terminus-like muramidase, partial [Dolichospermum sp.]
GKGKTEGYVPKDKDGKAIENSGVTVGTGIDLGQTNEAGIDALNIPQELKDKLKPYTGKTKQDAIDYLKDHPLTLSKEEVASLDNVVINKVTDNLIKKYNADSKIPFNELPSEAQTVIYSVEHQYGNAKTKTPNFWKQVTEQRWDDAVKNLENFGDKYPTRRNKEADLLQNVINANAGKPGGTSNGNGGGTPVVSTPKITPKNIILPQSLAFAQLNQSISVEESNFSINSLSLNLVQSDEPDWIPQTGTHYYTIFNLDRDTIDIRGSSSNGILLNQQVVLAPNTNYRIFVLQATTQWYGYYDFYTKESGSGVGIGNVVIGTKNFFDSDEDGLSNMAEFILGTDAAKYSTSNDGIGDGTKFQQGLDLFDGRAFPTGIISSLPLFGEAKGVVVEGSTTNTSQQTAYVATGSYGLAVVNTSQFNNPIILGQLDLAGDATDVAVDANLKIAAVATNNGGLQLVDVSDPMLPVLKQTININASQVEVVDGIAYATVGTSLRAVNLLSGEQIQQVTLPSSGTVTGLARDGSYLYGFISGPDIFFTVDISNSAAVTLKGQLTVSIASTDVGVFAGNGIASIAGSGLSTIDISNPANPTLISGSDNFFVARNVALNGSGLGLVSQEGLGVGLYSLSDPQNTNNFITSFDTPGFTYGVALASGIAYVADGTGGLQVINYLPFDNKGVAPTVTITSPVVDLDPNQTGIQITEGASISIQANVTDYVQVRNVELLVNGQVVSNDLSFPFDLQAIALSNDPNAPVVNVQTRVTDTGGNTSLSNILTFDLVPDTIAPSIDSFSANMRTATIRFSEALDTTKITAANFTLINSSNQTIVPENIQFRDGDRTIQLTYPALAVGNYQLVIDAAQLSDRALAYVKELPQLENLELYYTNVSDSGLQQIQQLTQLQSLNIGWTQVTDAGLSYLIGLTQLRKLNLDSTKISDIGLQKLETLINLQGLSLNDTNITENGFKNLSQYISPCNIDTNTIDKKRLFPSCYAP